MSLDRTLEQLIEVVDKANQDKVRLSEEFESLEFSKQIESLNKNVFAENSKKIKESYEEAIQLVNSDSAEDQKQGNEIIELLRQAVGDEEEAAEKAKAVADNNNALLKVAEGLGGLEKSLDSVIDGAASASFGIGALTLLFSPETLFAGITAAANFITKGIDSVGVALQGNFGPLVDFIKENFLAVAGTLTIFAVKFGLLSKTAALFKGVVKLWRAVQVSLSTGLLASAKSMLIAAAPFVAIGIAVGAVLFALYDTFSRAVSIFEESDSIGEGIARVATDIITAPLRWITNLASWVLEALGFEGTASQLDSIDLGTMLYNSIDSLFTSLGNWFTETFGIDIGTTLSETWNSITGGAGLLGLITAPIRLAGDWIASAFGFEAPEGEEGFVSAKIKEVWESIKKWLSGVLPSMDTLSNIASNINPLNWFGNDEDKAEATSSVVPVRENMADYTKELDVFSDDKTYAEVTPATKPVTPVRDNQVENNMLKYGREAATTNLILNQKGGGSTPPSAKVTSSTINLTNNVDHDRHMDQFGVSFSY